MPCIHLVGPICYFVLVLVQSLVNFSSKLVVVDALVHGPKLSKCDLVEIFFPNASHVVTRPYWRLTAGNGTESHSALRSLKSATCRAKKVNGAARGSHVTPAN